MGTRPHDATVTVVGGGWRLLLTKLLALIDSDSVRPFIWLYYLPFLLWGFYGTFAAEPIALIVKQMGQIAYDVWVVAPIPATIICLFGLWMRHGGSPAEKITHNMLRRDYLGLWMQFGGHTCMAMVLAVFEITGIAGAYWGQPVISVFLISSYSFGVFILALQCLRKLWRGRGYHL